MAGIGAIIIAIGIVALIYSGYMKYKTGRLSKAPFLKSGEVLSSPAAAANHAVSARGEVKCPAPLTSPVTGRPCLFYEIKINAHWVENGQDKRKDIVHERKAAAFSIDDGSGELAVDATRGGDFDLQETFNQLQRQGFVAGFKQTVAGAAVTFGNYSFPYPPTGEYKSFRCTESILPVAGGMFALGKIKDGAISTVGLSTLLLSPKSREELIGATGKNVQIGLFGGIGAIVLGAVIMMLA